MPRRMFQAMDVQQGMRGWTVLVQVVERCHPQLSHSSSPKKYVRLLLTDSEGTKVSAVIYGSDVRYFANLLLPFKRYYVSNATVNLTATKYRVSEYQFSWVINNATLVEELIEPVVPVLPCTFETTRFADLFKFADTEKLQNIKAIVIHALPMKEQGSNLTRTREFVVVNEEKIPMLLTMWNEFEAYDGANIASIVMTGPMIIAMRVKVTTFNSLSLTTRMSSCILVNPPLPQDMMLKDWFNANKTKLDQLVQAKAYKDPCKLLPPPKNEHIINVGTALATLQDVKTAWVKGNPKLLPGQQSYWYTACNNCHKSVNAEADWEIKCPACKEEAKVDIRCRMSIVLEDETGSLTATIFTPDCERLIELTALQLKQADDNGIALHDQVAASIQQHSVVAFLRCYEKDFQGHLNRRYNIVKAYTTAELTQLALTVDDEDMLLLLAAGHSPQHQPAITTSEECHFFTPTSKKLLDEISKSSNQMAKAASTMTGVKRNLSFSPINLQPKIEIKDNVVGSMPQTSSKTSAIESLVHGTQPSESAGKSSVGCMETEESPSKKNRDKLKLC